VGFTAGDVEISLRDNRKAWKEEAGNIPRSQEMVSMETKGKRAYSPPQLTVHGTVEEITMGCDKTYGNTDGFTFMGQGIQCVT
jgi:hypothetical protein